MEVGIKGERADNQAIRTNAPFSPSENFGVNLITGLKVVNDGGDSTAVSKGWSSTTLWRFTSIPLVPK